MSRWTFTSESVTEGHPDKIADQVSDAVLDAILAADPNGRVACETLLTTGLCVVAGEVTTREYVDIPSIARETIKSIGYDRESFGFDGNTCGVIVALDEQSPDIGQGVDTSEEVRSGKSGEDLLNAQGAGDQGMMFGYACDETDALMPLPIWLAHRMAERLAEVRRADVIPYLRPDGKTQVTFDYEDARPVRLRTVLISTQHAPGIDRDSMIRPDLIEHVIRPVVPEQFRDDDYTVLVNPTGQFVLGGPHADTGLTGRKIIVDTYGGMARHGGGAFSGKDPSKVDRSAAYAARWVAKHVVASGAAQPVRGAGGLRHRRGAARVACWSRRSGRPPSTPSASSPPSARCSTCGPPPSSTSSNLRQPIYRKTAAYGHFGRDEPGFTWEQLGNLESFKAAVGV